MEIYDYKMVIVTLMGTGFWAVVSLLHQYLISHYFKKYEKVSSIFNIFNPVLSIIIGFFILYLYKNRVKENNIDKHSLDMTNELQIFMAIVYIGLVFYAPAILAFMYIKITSFVIMNKMIYDKDDISSFMASSKAQNILAKTYLPESTKKYLLTKAFLNTRMPTMSDILSVDSFVYFDKFKPDDFMVILCFCVLLSLIYLLLIIRHEKKRMYELKSDLKFESDEREKLNKKLKNGPKDVYNEWLRVTQSINNYNSNHMKNKNKGKNKKNDNNNNSDSSDNNRNNNNNNNNNNSNGDNIALKAYQIIHDYILTASDIERIKQQYRNRVRNKYQYFDYDYDDEGFEGDISYDEEEEDKKKNKRQGRKDVEEDKTIFEKMDNRIVFDKSRGSYLNRVVGDVTFGVNAGECLGLLGPNGAGKTTAISIITGTVPHTYGTIIYGDKDLKYTDYRDLSLGYCSQFNSFWEHLTVKETIQFYLNICGYPAQHIHRYTKALIEACGIEKHSYKTINNISGGTKRKLSLIVSICSSPSYLILDEPSAGMDPFTRRNMWKIISGLKRVRKTATILTTHSTEEAEALCDRIAIMVKGRLLCIDTPRSIKMNHTNTYTLEVYTDKPEEFEEAYVKSKNLFDSDEQNNYQLESYSTYQKYTIKMKIESIAKVFSLMEEAKESGLIDQYNFGQYSLEQVFINFINNSDSV